jgi:hypothetical protein
VLVSGSAYRLPHWLLSLFFCCCRILTLIIEFVQHQHDFINKYFDLLQIRCCAAKQIARHIGCQHAVAD